MTLPGQTKAPRAACTPDLGGLTSTATHHAREGYPSAATSRNHPVPFPSRRIHPVRSGGAGVATQVTQGERSLRRVYAAADPRCGYSKRGPTRHRRTETEQQKAWSQPPGSSPLGVTKGKGCALRPTVDSIYLASRINETWDCSSLSPAVLQRFVNVYGDRRVEDVLRELHGFPPERLNSPYAYLEAMLRDAQP